LVWLKTIVAFLTYRSAAENLIPPGERRRSSLKIVRPWQLVYEISKNSQLIMRKFTAASRSNSKEQRLLERERELRDAHSRADVQRYHNNDSDKMLVNEPLAEPEPQPSTSLNHRVPLGSKCGMIVQMQRSMYALFTGCSAIGIHHGQHGHKVNLGPRRCWVHN